MIPLIDTRIYKLLDTFKALTSSGAPFEWNEHAFLIEPLCDFHPEQGIRKASQVGFSEMGIVKALYMAEHLKLNVLYTLPSDNFVKDFVPPKVDKILENNPQLYANVRGGTYQKKVGIGRNQRFIYFKGAHQTESQQKREETSKGVSITSDVNIHDEASKSDPFVMAQMMSRFSNSKYRGRWLFDNPTYPKVGADAIFDVSDQKHWIVACSHCGYKQYLDWYRLDKYDFRAGSNHCWIDPLNKIMECGKCRKSITSESIMNGEWIAKYPSRQDYRGYWINQLNYVVHNVASVLRIEEHPDTTNDFFANMVMGKPYIGSDVKISRENIVRNISNDLNPRTNNAMGIDQGNTKWFVVGNEKGIFLKGSTGSWDEIERIFNQYNCVAVCDALPQTSDPLRLAKKYPGRFFRAYYKPQKDQNKLALFSPKDALDTVLIRRNQMFDFVTDKIVQGQYPIQINVNDLQEFIDHWESIVRVVSEDKEMNHRFDWVRIADDHFAHATIYFETAKIKTRVGSAVVSQYNKKTSNKLPSYDTLKGSDYLPFTK